MVRYKKSEIREAQEWTERIYDVSYIGGLIKNSNNILGLRKLKNMVDMSIDLEISRIIIGEINNGNIE